VTFDCPDAPAELLDLGLKGAGVLELPAGTGRPEGTVQDGIKRHQALRSMGTRHHPRGHVTGPVPRAQRWAGDAGCTRCLLKRHPSILLRLICELGDQQVPVDRGVAGVVCAPSPGGNLVARRGAVRGWPSGCHGVLPYHITLS